jgi:NAD(P)-dependent dehydrogenase (short-subunit alcohol dehydrogenase family)
MSRIGDNLEKLFSLKGKAALVTGAGGGIGAELARGLAAAGAEVALCDIRMEPLQAVQLEIEAAGGAASSHLLNVSDKPSVDAAVEDIIKAYGHIDVLINCAGINKREGLLDVEEETYDRIMDVNLKGVFLVSQAVGLHMIRQHTGSIINIGSHNTGAVLGGVSVYAEPSRACWR